MLSVGNDSGDLWLGCLKLWIRQRPSRDLGAALLPVASGRLRT
jgi:hypothetical protein